MVNVVTVMFVVEFVRVLCKLLASLPATASQQWLFIKRYQLQVVPTRSICLAVVSIRVSLDTDLASRGIARAFRLRPASALRPHTVFCGSLSHSMQVGFYVSVHWRKFSPSCPLEK